MIRSDSTEVLVDVVVRDKHGKTHPWIEASDVVLTEDGKPRRSPSFAGQLAGGSNPRPSRSRRLRPPARPAAVPPNSFRSQSGSGWCPWSLTG